MRILLADHEPRVCSALRLLLEQQPVADIVEEVANTQELQDHVRNHYPDVLLLDWALPGYTPKNLLTSLRNFHPDLFIIVLDSEPQTRQIALVAGANEFISKNEPPEKLLAAIKSYRVSNKRRTRSN